MLSRSKLSVLKGGFVILASMFIFTYSKLVTYVFNSEVGGECELLKEEIIDLTYPESDLKAEA